MAAVPWKDLAGAGRAEDSASMRSRVLDARQRAASRRPAVLGFRNADLSAEELAKYCALDHQGLLLLERAVARLCLSVRAVHRALRVGRTIADLAQGERVAAAHLAEAFSFRAPALVFSCPNEQVDTRARAT
jgi:magnesium chelatase family protein